MKKKRKGQAAIEFMTTYGWALMAIIVAVGAISYFDFLDAGRYVSSSCNTGNQVSCVQSVIIGNDFNIALRNNQPVDINVTEIRLIGPDGTVHTYTANKVISRGTLAKVTPGNIAYLFGTISEGNKYELDIEIEYKRLTPAGTPYTIQGNTVVKAS